MQKLVKPDETEDEIVNKHISQLQKKYMDFLKETES